MLRMRVCVGDEPDGAAVGGLAAIAVLPGNPPGIARAHAGQMIAELTGALTSAADAIEERDPEVAGRALRRIRTQQPIDDYRDALRTAREILAISPLHRRQRHLLRSYLDAAEPLDHALRNCRVLLRRTRSALTDDEAVPPSLPAGLRELAAATTLLAEELGQTTTATREALRAAAATIDNDSLAHSGFSARVVAAQLRSVAVDLLQATGLRHDEARAILPTSTAEPSTVARRGVPSPTTRRHTRLMATPIILDCDPGHDDALAIMLAAAHPAVRLLAISTVAGNQTLDKTTRNARRICDVAGVGVPIVVGRAEPLRGKGIVAADVHGESGLDGPSFGPPVTPLASTDGVGYLRDLLRDLLRDQPEPVTVVATGPLTNIAALLLAAPDVVANVDRIVFMGGSTGQGNVTPYAEFNVYADPEAADIVLHSGIPVSMCGLNVTHQALADDSVRTRIAAIGSPLARVCVDLLGFFGSTYREIWGFPAPPLHDPVAVALLVEPDVVETVRTRVDIELAGTFTRGATVVDLYSRTGRPPNADVAVRLDVPRFWDLVVTAIERLSIRE